jgi:hypothetical protein
LALTALALSGCVTVSNTLSPAQVASFKLARVDVVAPPEARISWGDGEVAYAATKGLPAHEAGKVATTPEARAFVRYAVTSKLRSALERELGGTLLGGRPVRLEVTIRDIEIASVIQRILIGGSHSMKADATIVDARTGAVLLRFPAQTAVSAAGQGIGGTLVDAATLDAPIDRVVRDYAAQYRRWLLNS